ncbi:MAG: glutamate--tRNA ligase [Opitutaceae bacterium]|nr:glutamate--tRNA ligase [Cytophagales bacterium]
MNREVRVRFAPSPTGALHIGGVRTALYNYLFARKMGGKMLLRIEDTDQNRFVEFAEKYIQEALAWVGIKLDESPWQEGPNAPYRQSERKPMYMQYAMQLVNEGKAYYAFDTSEELDEMRKRMEAAKVVSPAYNSITRVQMKNSLTLPEDEVKVKLAAGEPYVIRIKVPRKEEIRFHDLIRGWVMVHSSTLDDKVLMKSDGMPTYHLANIVDDHLMNISHVIRGEEWLPSAPLHILLYKYLGWEDSMPEFAHLPLLLKPDGNGKLSKRDADMHGFPVFPLEWKGENGDMVRGFREDGYLPEAMVNFLAMLGWNPGTNQELFTMDELIKEFSLEKISKSGAKFDINKAKWFNQQYLKQMPDEVLGEKLLQGLKTRNIECSSDKASKIAHLLKERVVFDNELAQEAIFFFEAPQVFSEEAVKTKWSTDTEFVAKNLLEKISKLSSFSAAEVKAIAHEIIEEKGLKLGKVMPGVRMILTGATSGPDLMEIIEVLGKEEVISRLKNGIEKLSASLVN